MSAQSTYMKERRAKRRQAILEFLGNKCAFCNTILDLQIDHKNPMETSFRLTGSDLDRNWEQVLTEAKKCQLLCEFHHKAKTNTERKSRLKHGTEWMYKKYCRCEVCVKGFAEQRKFYKSRKTVLVWQPLTKTIISVKNITS